MADENQEAEGVADKQADKEPVETMESAVDAALAEEEDVPEAEKAEGAADGQPEGESEDEPEAGGQEAEKEGEPGAEKESEKEGEDKGADKQAVEAENKEGDDDIPAGLSERAQTRFRELRDRAVGAEQQVTQFTDMLSSTGATPQEFGALVEYTRLAHSQAPADAEQALRILDAEREALAKRIGKEVPGVDMLAEYPDLAQRVEAMDLDKSAALEVAHARRQQAQYAQQQQAQAQQSQQQQQAQQSEQRAMAALNQLGEKLAQSDPDYEAKINILVQHSVPWIKANLPPAQWAGAFDNAYQQLGATLATQRQTQAKRTAPLRPSGAGGGSHKEPASMEDAIAAALGGDE